MGHNGTAMELAKFAMRVRDLNHPMLYFGAMGISSIVHIPSGVDATQVLRAFRSDSPYLFTGAAFIGFGLVAAGFVVIRRKFDALLVYFALFASLYGFRLWIQAEIFGIMFAGSVPFARIASAINYLIPIPAFLFFDSAGLLHRTGRVVGYILTVVGISLAMATCLFGSSRSYTLINNVTVISAVLVLVAGFVHRGSQSDADYIVIRRGLLILSAFVFLENFRSALSLPWPPTEPIGFVVLLGSLGYVSARRALQRDQQLNRIQKELEVAKTIQLSILPAKFPPSRHFAVEARYVPVSSVAGDFYEYVLADHQQTGLLIADVSGHGVPAALIASMVKLAAASQRAHATEPSKFLAGMNAALCGNTQGQFVTAAYVHLDANSGELRYAAAGHPPMMLVRGGMVEELEENGLLLAAFESAAYTETVRPLRNGDRILLYTDGIIEAANLGGEFFGRERLGSLLIETACLAPAHAADRILYSARDWSPTQEDDFTIIICDFVG